MHISDYRAVYAIGVLSLFLGIIALMASDRLSEATFLGIIFLINGLLYLVLGFFVQRKSKIALGIAVGLMLLNYLTGIQNTIQTDIYITLFKQTKVWTVLTCSTLYL